MDVIIHKKRYNTETANFLARRTRCTCARDEFTFPDQLFQKTNGEYFLYLPGSDPDYDARIVPVTEEEAMDWVERNCEATVYIKLFGEVEE